MRMGWQLPAHSVRRLASRNPSNGGGCPLSARSGHSDESLCGRRPHLGVANLAKQVRELRRVQGKGFDERYGFLLYAAARAQKGCILVGFGPGAKAKAPQKTIKEEWKAVAFAIYQVRVVRAALRPTVSIPPAVCNLYRTDRLKWPVRQLWIARDGGIEAHGWQL